jgi:hypothetical protein
LRERDHLLISGSSVFDVSEATGERKRNDETIRGDNTGFSPNFDGRIADKISKILHLYFGVNGLSLLRNVRILIINQ